MKCDTVRSLTATESLNCTGLISWILQWLCIFFLFLILANTMLYPDLIQAVFYAGDRFWARENRRRKKIKAQQLEELLNLVFSLILR